MPKANRSSTTRRRFLTSAAGAAAAIAAASLASGATDPIFAAIEAYRNAVAARNAFFAERSLLEDEDTLEMDLADAAAFNVEVDATSGLLSVVPTTMGGVAAVLAYTAEKLKAGLPPKPACRPCHAAKQRR
jgi:hypothetical protein